MLALFTLAIPVTAEEPPLPSPAAAVPEPVPVTPQDPPQEAAPPGREAQFRTMDRLELGTTSITGNQELPKVMYVVPWKKAELGDLSGRPARSLIDEILAPVDRDVFRREVGYFETLSEGMRDSSTQGENPVTPETARP
jgi:hypothetical protein